MRDRFGILHLGWEYYFRHAAKLRRSIGIFAWQ
jgi:hypothetical protein